MMVVERAALRRVTMVVSVRSWSSGKLANSGTAFRTAVETVVAIGEIALSLCKSMLAESRPYNFCRHGFASRSSLPAADSRFRPRRLYRRGVRGAGEPEAGAR